MKKIKRETVISVVVVIFIFVLWFVSTANAWVDTKLDRKSVV